MGLKVALVGCGKAADMHVMGIQRLPQARLIAVCDSEPIMGEQLARRYAIARHYSDFDQLLEIEKPNVVHVATPPQSHFSLAMRALDAGCHLVVEKPLAFDARQAAQLIAHAESCSRKLTIGYTYHFDPAMRMLRKLVADGDMGDPVHLEVFLGYNLNGPYGTPILGDTHHWVHELPGKIFHNLLDHLLEKITEYVTDESPVVQAHSWQRANGFPQHHCDLPDELRVAVIGERTSANLTFSSHSRPIRHLLRLCGTKNSALVNFDNSTIILDGEPSLPGVLGRLTSPFSVGWQHIREGSRNVFRFARADYHFFSGFYFLLSEFYNSIVHDLPVPICYRDILRAAALLDEIVDQVEGERVQVE